MRGLAAAVSLCAATLASAAVRADDIAREQIQNLDRQVQSQFQQLQNSIRNLQIQLQQYQNQFKEQQVQRQQDDNERSLSLDARMAKVETSIKNLGLIELVGQVDTLNVELNKMRGEIEVLRNLVDKTEKRQREFYVDLDYRLRKVESGAAAAPRSGETSPSPKPAQPAAASTEPAPATSQATTAPRESASTETTASAPASAPAATAPIANISQPATSVAVAPPSASRSSVRDSATENKLYDDALRLFRAGNYTAAVNAFNTFVDKYPASVLAPNAQYWIGVSYFNLRDFKNAMHSNQTLISGYPDSAKVPDAMLNMASIHVEQGDHSAARDVLEDIINQFPATDAANKARSRLSLLKR